LKPKYENTILKINHISVEFDGFYALSDIDIEVPRNQIHFLIGPNGAGKTTLLDIICAKTKPTEGTIYYYPTKEEEIRISGLKEHQIVNHGVCRKFQVPSVFVNLSVQDNMVLSLKGNKGVFRSLFYKTTKAEQEKIDALLIRIELIDKKNETAGALAHGQKQWLEIAMQLVAEPALIMLDEPAAGMGKYETMRTGEILKEISETTTAVVVEHDMEFVKEFSDKVTVLHEGKVLTEGAVKDVLSNQTVKEVYLGRGKV
jgi:urea transport system ATP-binding protein